MLFAAEIINLSLTGGTWTMKYELKRLTIDNKEEIKELFAGVFTQEPWNDDWSDQRQLDLYITDIIGQSNSLTYGLYDGCELIGVSMGYIKHWFTGTEYIIGELCIKTERQGAGAGTFFISEIERAVKQIGLVHIFLQTDKDAPAYSFYKKNGFVELNGHVSFAKKL